MLVYFSNATDIEFCQEMLVDEIENGIYSSRSPISRVDYTMDLINRAKGLEKYTESELVKKLAIHHEVDIRWTVKN